MAAPTPKMRALIYKRDGGRCVSCGSTAGLTVQHRKTVGMGGTKTLPTVQELVTACLPCNQGFEAELQTKALEHGWKLRRFANPAEVPVYYAWAHSWYLLKDNGLLKAVDRESGKTLTKERNF